MSRSILALASLFVAGTAFAGDVEVPYDAYLDLETGRWATESDCFSGLVDCRPMDVKVRWSETHEPHTFLEFPRAVGQARTGKAPADVKPEQLADLAVYGYASSYGFLPETLVVTKGTRTFAIQLVREEKNEEAVLRYSLVSATTAVLVD